MDIRLYQQDDIEKKVIFQFPNLTLTTENITENLTYTENVNSTVDFAIGSTGAAQLNFEIINLNQLITDDQIKKEFLYKEGLSTGKTNFYKVYRAIRASLLCIKGTVAYGGKNNDLSIWDISSNTPKKLTAPEQPDQPIHSLFVVDNTLYCGHRDSPYLTAYRISGASLSKIEPPQLNQYQINKILNFNREARVFNYSNNILKEYRTRLLDMRVVDYFEKLFEFIDIGYFTCLEPVRKNDNLISMSCYDRMIKFSDTIADDFVNHLVYPISSKNLLIKLCEFVGIPLKAQSFFNDDFIVPRNFYTQNMSARQILQWIAELACCFGVIDDSGSLILRWYEEIDYTVKNDYIEVNVSEYATKKIDKLSVRSSTNDVGVIVGNGNNLYVIENNGLLYANEDAELRPTAEKIFNRIKDFTYVPYNIKTKGNYLIKAGQIINIETIKGAKIKGILMSRTLTGVNALRDTYQATGNQQRESQSSLINQQIQRLRGRTNELSMNLEETRNTLTTVSTQVGKVQTDVNGVATRLDTVTTEVGDLQLTSKGLTAQISKTEQSLNTVSGDLTTTKQQVSSLKLAVDNFSVTLSNTQTDLNGTKEQIASLKLSLDSFVVSIENSGIEFTPNGLKTHYTQNRVTYTLLFGDGKLSSTRDYGNGKSTGIVIDGSKISFYFDGKEGPYIQGYVYEGYENPNRISIEGYIHSLSIYKLTFQSLDYVFGGDVFHLYPYTVSDTSGTLFSVLGFNVLKPS